MKLSTFTQHLESHPDAELRFILPDGDVIPAHFHITEVGRVDKAFMDCGGATRHLAHCTLQAWVAENDEAHRFAPGKLARVLAQAAPLFRGEDLEVEVEYEDCAISQFPVETAEFSGGLLTFHLSAKHTDCLAKEVCFVPRPAGEKSGCC